VIEALLGPIHLRLLLTGERIDDAFLQDIVEVVVNGVARRTSPATARPTMSD
jgi:hypothetical protein